MRREKKEFLKADLSRRAAIFEAGMTELFPVKHYPDMMDAGPKESGPGWTIELDYSSMTKWELRDAVATFYRWQGGREGGWGVCGTGVF